MGWWSNLWGTTSDDPLGKLDPSLREFLEKESPVKYNSSSPSQSQHPASAPVSQHPTTSSTVTSTTETPSATERYPNGVPPESAFQDGRYAHLWKTYKPLSAVEAETKSDHEKLMDVLEAYKTRKEMIGAAALENCALEQVEWRECMTDGGWEAKITMCREKMKKFERCYMMQSRLLKALGYLSTVDRPAEVDEDIQLHADSLYHRMQEQEAAVEKAKAEGKPIPQFAPLIPRQPPATIPGSLTAPGNSEKKEEFSAEEKRKLKERLEKVAEEDRPAEEAAFKAELRAKQEIASKVKSLWDQQREEREQRKAQGTATIWDKAATVFNPADSGKK